MLDKTYDPKEIEARRYPEWESSGAFRAHPESAKPPYCIVIPPPNVTGSLHMGHALDKRKPAPRWIGDWSSAAATRRMRQRQRPEPATRPPPCRRRRQVRSNERGEQRPADTFDGILSKKYYAGISIAVANSKRRLELGAVEPAFILFG